MYNLECHSHATYKKSFSLFIVIFLSSLFISLVVLGRFELIFDEFGSFHINF